MRADDDDSAAMDTVAGLFSSNTSLIGTLKDSGDFGTISNLVEASTSILNSMIKPSNNNNNKTNITAEEMQQQMEEKQNRIKVISGPS